MLFMFHVLYAYTSLHLICVIGGRGEGGGGGGGGGRRGGVLIIVRVVVMKALKSHPYEAEMGQAEFCRTRWAITRHEAP